MGNSLFYPLESVDRQNAAVMVCSECLPRESFEWPLCLSVHCIIVEMYAVEVSGVMHNVAESGRRHVHCY